MYKIVSHSLQYFWKYKRLSFFSQINPLGNNDLAVKCQPGVNKLYSTWGSDSAYQVSITSASKIWKKKNVGPPVPQRLQLHFDFNWPTGLCGDADWRRRWQLTKEACLYYMYTWAASWQNQQNNFAPSEDSDQPGHPQSLIRVFPVRMTTGWSESSLGAHSLCWFCHDAAHIQARQCAFGLT